VEDLTEAGALHGAENAQPDDPPILSSVFDDVQGKGFEDPNIILFSMMIWLMTRRFWATILASALFAIHPMRVESVVWAAERKDVLYTFFYLLSVLAYIYYITHTEHKAKYYILALIFFLCSLWSKGQAVVLPLTLFLIDYWLDRKLTLKSVLNKIPFFVLSLLFGFIAIQAQSSSLTTERMMSYTFFDRVIFAAYNLFAYLFKFIWPYDLACFYGYPASDGMWIIYSGAALALILLIWIFWFKRKNKTIMFGVLYFLFTIFIVVQILPVGNAIIADRYTYIPYIGFFFIVAMLLDPYLSSAKIKTHKLVLSLVVIQLFVFAGASFLQAQTWRNNETLWRRVIEHDANEGMAYNNLSIHYINEEQYDTAIALLNKCLMCAKPYPEMYKAYQNLGKAYSEKKQYKDAIQHFNAALDINPQFLEAHFGKGLVYADAGRYDSAIAIYTRIIMNIKPTHAESYYSRAMAYSKLNQTDFAIRDYTEAIRIKPDYESAYTNRGNIFFNNNQFDEAIRDYTQSRRCRPDDGNTYRNRSFAYFRTGDYQEALDDAEKAAGLGTQIHPDYLKDLRTLLAGKKDVSF